VLMHQVVREDCLDVALTPQKRRPFGAAQG
jgi:hypothetical protein